MGDGDCNTVGEEASLPLSPVKTWRRRHREVKDMANCENCKKVQNAPESVPYIVHEASMARMERQIKRLWITVLILVFLLVGTNATWLYYESQWETICQEVTQEADNDTNNFICGDLIGETDYQNP